MDLDPDANILLLIRIFSPEPNLDPTISKPSVIDVASARHYAVHELLVS